MRLADLAEQWAVALLLGLLLLATSRCAAPAEAKVTRYQGDACSVAVFNHDSSLGPLPEITLGGFLDFQPVIAKTGDVIERYDNFNWWNLVGVNDPPTTINVAVCYTPSITDQLAGAPDPIEVEVAWEMTTQDDTGSGLYYANVLTQGDPPASTRTIPGSHATGEYTKLGWNSRYSFEVDECIQFYLGTLIAAQEHTLHSFRAELTQISNCERNTLP